VSVVRHRLQIEIDVDEQAVADHVAKADDEYPLVAAVDEWHWRDLEGALSRGLADEPEVVDYETA
jgi:hypothetical protein